MDLYIKVGAPKRQVVTSIEINNGVIIERDEQQQVVGVEVLGARALQIDGEKYVRGTTQQS